MRNGIFWSGAHPLPMETEEKTLRAMCLTYVAMLNPAPAELERDHITRRCQHCQNIFQHPSDKKLQLYCVECR
jgi:hypothetical protein